MRIPIFLWLVLIAIFSSCFCKNRTLASGQCLSLSDQSLLLSLKNGLHFNASLSTKLVEWTQGSSSWPGVTCVGGQVTGLDLSNESISDGINSSSSLFSFRYLKSLNLAFNRFNSMEIPPQVATLSSLEHLNLSNAGFTGQIPVEIANLTGLTTLDLSMLYFPGISSLKLQNPNLRMLVRSLAELKELYLDGVNISAPGSEWCGALSSSLPKLEVLSMSNCYLNGPIDASFMNLKSLSVIRLGSNNLSTEVPDFFANFSSLTALRLSTSGLFGMFPQKIFQVLTLQNLDVSYNSLLHGSLPEFSADSPLRAVDLSFTNFSGILPYSIGNLRNLSRLVLANCSFSGQIPITMTKLSQLVYLDFSTNNFSGPVPSFTNSGNMTQIILSHNSLTGEIISTRWEYLQNLENLDLRYNSLEGSIPSSLFALPRIQKIQLLNNRFSGHVQLNESLKFSSYALDTLDLSNNKLDGPIPPALFRYPELKYLSLAFNNFNGSLDIDVVQKVSRLSYLDLSCNNLSINAGGAASTNSSFPPFSTISLASCHLKALPGFLSNQPKLMYLDLSDNEIHGSIPMWMWTLKNLRYLNLSLNFFEDVETAEPNITSTLSLLDLHSNSLGGKMPPLPPLAVYVDYSGNNFSSIIPADIGKNLSVTIFFSLSKNSFQGNIPESICQAWYLQVLDLSDNSFTGKIPSCMVDVPSLKVLNLRNNKLNGCIPEGFPRTCGLKTLDLSRNSLQGQIPQSLSNCMMLEVLDIGNNQIEGGFPCHLKNTTKMRVLVMRGNKLSGQLGCPDINNSPWDLLQIVDLASNDFSTLPPERCLRTWKAMQDNDGHDHLQLSFLGISGLYYQDTVTVTVKGLTLELVKILKVFTSIDISENRISGQIPNALGTFKSLRLLNMSGNELFGPIPPSLGNLQVLESLDLSRNNLTDNIPPALTNLNFLALLNLSYNRLMGLIPSGSQFATFGSSSYVGNMLCGKPLTKNCTNADRALVPKSPGVHLDWQFIVTGLGFGSGAAVAVAPFMMWRKGRRWYNNRIDRFLLVFLPILGFTYTIWDDEESEDGHGDDVNDDTAFQFDLEKEETWGRYCVFCSKLDHTLKKVIHDSNCTCYDSPYNSSPSSSSSSYSSSSSS
ncbi:hypothetical protein CDL15_Pgr007730 [Punica granatum]|uniref:Disease resistance R13L4/SHOC-2-like LRR domain-containing protein n=1 Tax=Punica granatum TaxID=22663 RepID=A0A218XBG1_PUNGR|nr:hypothetical protein CDL15_Pgr007730 [Punica granatum]